MPPSCIPKDLDCMQHFGGWVARTRMETLEKSDRRCQKPRRDGKVSGEMEDYSYAKYRSFSRNSEIKWPLMRISSPVLGAFDGRVQTAYLSESSFPEPRNLGNFSQRAALGHVQSLEGRSLASVPWKAGSIDDLLDDLLGDDMTLPEKPVKVASRARDTTDVSQMFPSSKARTKSFLGDGVFSPVAGLEEADAEVSGVSEADPQALLQAMKDLDGMDADILGLKMSNPVPSKKAAKDPGKGELPNHPKPVGESVASEKGAGEMAPRIC
ncbi:hypothetical protein P7K49_011831 [Saguinus oedipus]|uniref:Uncharacterized protein n=1 Tax=Saguinus oedipus TaxID=9490 RepID=A0ABQ9VRT4_SAGOE|nr:hypothetical protein P7K49_011831 [Saguinus oedipus]